MTTQTKPWAEMTTQEKHLALAEMMGWTKDHKKSPWWTTPTDTRHADNLQFVTDYDACFEGPVAWAKAQGATVEIHIGHDDGYVNAWFRSGKNEWRLATEVSPDAICQAIYEAWRESQ